MCVRVHGHSLASDSLWPHGLQPTRLLCPWNSPGKNTGVSSHSLLQGIFPTQGSNLWLLHLLHCQADSLPLFQKNKNKDTYHLLSTYISLFPFFPKSYATLQSSFYSCENLALGMLCILSMVTHFIWTCHVWGMPGQDYPKLCPSRHYSTLLATKEQIQHAANVHLHGNNVHL